MAISTNYMNEHSTVIDALPINAGRDFQAVFAVDRNTCFTAQTC
jgi:hypothetical protein